MTRYTVKVDGRSVFKTGDPKRAEQVYRRHLAGGSTAKLLAIPEER